MAKLFSGYAQNRGFQKYSGRTKARAIDESTNQTLRGLERQRLSERNAAITQQDQLRKTFEIEQQNRQRFLEVETSTAQAERDAKSQMFEAEIARIDNEEKERTEIFRSLANVSSTAADILEKEAVKRKKAEIELGTNLVLQYGLTGEEVQQLQTLEGGLKDFDNQQAPIISRLRSIGASELDINNLMQASGWRAHGQALGAVQNAAASYDQYLAENYSTDVNINGADMSLASAEDVNDVEAVAGILDRHRMNFVSEYLPGFDAAFIAKHARESMITAEGRRKRSMNNRMEETARDANEAQEYQDFLVGANEDLTDPSYVQRKILTESGGLESPTLRAVTKKNHDFLIRGLESGALPKEYGEKILTSKVVAKHFGNQEVEFRRAFPQQAAEIKKAVADQDKEERRLEDIVRRDKLQEGQDLADAAVQMLIDKEGQYDDATVLAAIKAVRRTGNDNAANRLTHFLEFTTEKVNDKEFKDRYATRMQMGIYPSTKEILDAGLSPEYRGRLLRERKELIDTGYTDDVQKSFTKQASALLKAQFQAHFANSTTNLPQSFTPALEAAERKLQADFAIAYKGPKTLDDAKQYAINELKKEIANPNGMFRVELNAQGQPNIANPNFPEFAGTSLQIRRPDLNAVIDTDHMGGQRGFEKNLYIDRERLEKLAIKLNAGEDLTIPNEFHSIQRATGGNIPLSDIILAQFEIAQDMDPNFTKLSDNAMKLFKEVEAQVDPDMLRLIQKYQSPGIVDQAFAEKDLPTFYDRKKPYKTLYKLLEPYNVRPELMPLFGAVMMGESSGDPAIDTVKSGLDVGMREEYSIGLLQVNTKAHMDKLRAKGYTMDDLRNPIVNVEIAMDVWEEWIGVLMDRDPTLTREEAEVSALDRWGAYGHDSKGNKGKGPYLDYLPDARKAYEMMINDRGKPTWEQSSHMNPTAQRWIEMHGGTWSIG